MKAYEILVLLGVPSLCASLFLTLVGYVRKNKKDTDAVKRGVQALLRAQMIRDYNKYKEKGCAPIYAKQAFENCWEQYHILGANGVMNNIHREFMCLPNEGE